VHTQFKNFKIMNIKNEAVEALLKVAPYARIAHHIKGRVRLKFSLAAVKTLANIDVPSTLGNIPGIFSHRLNAQSGSVVIEYDPHIIVPGLWEELASFQGNSDKENLLKEHLLELWEENQGAEHGTS